MKHTKIKVILSVLLAFSGIFGCALPLGAVEADPQNPENRMAYNIYAYPQFGDLPNAFAAYSMDIYVENGAPLSYWSFANFNMYFSEKTKEKYPDIEGGGAYAGIQTHGEDAPRRALLAFWNWQYWPDGGKPDEPLGTHYDGTPDWGETNLLAERVYPINDNGSSFGNEAEGANYIYKYAWEDQHWYRLMLYTWTNEETGTTMCGFWIGDLESGMWTLIAAFDTKLYDSYLVGEMRFFMQNFVGGAAAGQERDFRIKNICVKRYDTGEWVMIDTVKLSHCNNWANNKIGKHSFGATETYFWGKSGGYLAEGESQEQHDADWPEKAFTLSQNDITQMPALDSMKPGVSKMFFRNINNVWRFRWDAGPGSMQYSYSVKAMDENGKELYSDSAVDLTADRVDMKTVKTDVFYVELTLTDMFGNSATYHAFSDKYIEKYGENLPSDLVVPELSLPQNQPDDDGTINVFVLLGVAIGAVALIAIVLVAIDRKELK